MKKWIINADDFGYSRAVNYGIIDAHRLGIVSSTTMMTNMPGAEHAVQLAKENKDLGVGIHLVLTCGKPVRDDVPSLVDENGKFRKLADLEKYATYEDVEKEWTSQIERFLSFGLTPTHLDSHHHVHIITKFYKVMEKLAEKYQLPVRPAEKIDKKFQPVEFLFRNFYGNHLTSENTLQMFAGLLEYNSVEIMCHPAYLDSAILNGSSYAKERVLELEILTDSPLRNFLKSNDIQLVRYNEL